MTLCHWAFKQASVLTLSCFSFFLRTSSHSLTIRPHRIHESSSRWERLEEAEELDTREEPLFRLEPFMERSDLLSVSRSLRFRTKHTFYSSKYSDNKWAFNAKQHK